MAGPGRPGPTCGVARALDQLDDSGREVIVDIALPDDGYSNGDLVAALREYLGDGAAALTVAQMKHHRSHQCRCHAEDEA